MPIILGMGTGRCGSMSLAKLLSLQRDSFCFHQLNPAPMAWEGAWDAVRSLVMELEDVLAGGPRNLSCDPRRGELPIEFREIAAIRFIGDVGLYYLPYVPQLVDSFPDLRMPCLKRDRASTIASLRHKQLERPDTIGRRNPYVEHDGTRWVKHPVWYKCFPKFDVATYDEGVGRYWDHYYDIAARYEAEYPDRFRVFPIESLNDETGQRSILAFCGFEEPLHLETVHVNRGR